MLRGDFTGCESLLKEALAIRERAEVRDEVKMADLGALGVLAYSRGRAAKAVAYNQRRVDSLRRLPPGHEIEISDALNDLSISVQQARADYVTAKRLA